MSIFSLIVDGDLVPVNNGNSGPTPQSNARLFQKPFRIDTGDKECDKVGSLLLRLASRDGLWHGVPWAMLRNEYMQHGMLMRMFLRVDDAVPDLYTGRFVGNTGKFLQTLCRMNDTNLIKYPRGAGSDLIYVMDKLAACAVPPENLMTGPRHI